MSDALLVLNAGSSSLKFSVFLSDDPPRLLLHGQLEGLLTQPRFIARNDDCRRRRKGVAVRDSSSDITARSNSFSPGVGKVQWASTASLLLAIASCMAA